MTISVGAFRLFQYATVTVLTVLGTLFYLYAERRDGGALHGILTLFDPGSETSVTTSFAVLNLLIASVLLFVVHRHARQHGEPMPVQWLILSVIFFALSVDEGAMIHERIGTKFYDLVGIALPIIETHRWLLGGALFTLLVALFFTPFLLRLDVRTRVLFALSGGVFVIGALGFEFVGALMMAEGRYTRADLLYSLRRILEEGCELFGIAIFNSTLMELIHRRAITFGVRCRS